MRNIYLKDPGPPQVDAWMGQSVGRWEKGAFVIETNGFNDQSWVDRAGNHHREALKVTERFTMTGPDHIQYEATIEDPKLFTRPWTIAMLLYRHVNKDARLGQFKCVEFIEELAGVRHGQPGQGDRWIDRWPGSCDRGGLLLTNSGYGQWRGKPGNVLLAFEVGK